MTERDRIKQRNIDLADSLYRDFKAMCGKRGISMRAGFAEALRQWLMRHSSGERPVAPLATVTYTDPSELTAAATLLGELIALVGAEAAAKLLHAGKEIARARDSYAEVGIRRGTDIVEELHREMDSLERSIREGEDHPGENSGGTKRPA